MQNYEVLHASVPTRHAMHCAWRCGVCYGGPARQSNPAGSGSKRYSWCEYIVREQFAVCFLLNTLSGNLIPTMRNIVGLTSDTLIYLFKTARVTVPLDVLLREMRQRLWMSARATLIGVHTSK